LEKVSSIEKRTVPVRFSGIFFKKFAAMEIRHATIWRVSDVGLGRERQAE